MSAISIGGDTALNTESKGKGPQARLKASPESSAPAAFAKWIPGEALTFYAAILGLGAAQPALTGRESDREILERIEPSAASWFFGALAIAVGLVVVGALSAKQDEDALLDQAGDSGVGGIAGKALLTRCGLTALSFTVWATALPGAWPWGWSGVRDMGPAYALLLVPVAVLFSGFAQWLTTSRRL